MKLYLSTAVFYNRAPFKSLKLNFDKNEIAVLTAINGRGKTTILSHIVDAFHEIARPFFLNEYEGKENDLYRVSSFIENLDFTKPSLAYLRFITSSGDIVDYANVRNALTEVEYNAFELPDNKIPFSELKNYLDQSNFVRMIFPKLDQKKIEEIFRYNLLTYFPAYRHESPAYLNDPYKIELNFTKRSRFNGYLANPIEVVSGLPQLANWIMDIVLDMRIDNENAKDQLLFHNLNKILTNSIVSKDCDFLRFGVGPRGLGSVRIQVVKNCENDQETLYPSIFNISSGESSMLCLFGELIRQADNISKDKPLEAISGIVLVDEIDKHLHIRLQKEILPTLLTLFPNIQFIISSHSPFLSMGLAEIASERAKIVDLETFGISKDPTTNELYTEVYRMMIGENDRFKELYSSLEEKIRNGNVPLVITEGKTDVQHLKSAMSRLNINDLEFQFFVLTESWGDSKLKSLLEQLSKVSQSRKIIGIFDRDVESIVADIEKDGRAYKIYGNNVFAFCLPVPPGREQYTQISIEFFYQDSDLKKEKNGKRLYFDNEVYIHQSAAKPSERNLVKRNNVNLSEENSKKIYDQNIGQHDWIHSKAEFANLVESDPGFANNFDFSSFHSIFRRLREIITSTNFNPAFVSLPENITK
ncbi:AAA family ATPase [Nitrosomonas sp. Is37]|uniref:AAA family ATPase n=1 Tax=Nitrosomonas sp. Is37 TaxID=3080535 RepID=UPI00294B1E35|nr:AAA family ATPase [Nitrosomonas sp. Is37]MDV6343605.1 AAA family ATPase [Nitrosomonas sp. Is37]